MILFFQSPKADMIRIFGLLEFIEKKETLLMLNPC